MSTIIRNARIVTMNKEKQVINRGYVWMKNGFFIRVEEGEPDNEIRGKANEVVDAKGKWLMPGLINTHGHPAMTLMRGMSDDLPLNEWLEQDIWPFESKLDERATKVSRELAMVEMIKSGTTTFLDMYHLHLPDFAEAVLQSGMRATLMRSVIGLCSKEEQDAKLNESLAFACEWHKKGDGRIQTMLAPHALYTCPPDYVERIVEAARDAKLPVHMHLAETRKEITDVMDNEGIHPLELLEDRHLLEGTEWLFAHGVHMHEQHMELLQSRNAAISHNPKSNLKLGSGVAPVASMLKHGVIVGLGTDSAASNNTLDLFEEMRMAILLQRGINEQADMVETIEALQMATTSGAQALRFDHLGTIEQGKLADFILLDPRLPHLQPEENILSHLVFAAKASDVTDVFVQGTPLMKDNVLLTLDEEAIMYEANRVYRRLNDGK
ncbi:amidohydrolase [Shouchella shacheensis]|uniref:amidohydrolase n=1 Tax=Shouchella shacheensis TaxID=1649580 RepID=UPI0007400394|nr:amidohydrolase [Shouchella shacheensis]